MLLDGSRASFLLSVGDISALEKKSNDVLSWSWSSHVTHSILADPEQQVVIARRWDSPTEAIERDLRDPGDIAQLVSAFEKSPLPSRRTAIEKALEVFRMLRQNVEDEHGDAVELTIAFNYILTWCREFSRGNTDAAYPGKTLADLVRRLPDNSLRRIAGPSFGIPERAMKFPVGEMVDAILSTDPETRYALDPDLLIRHASGALYQEAHQELLRPSVRGRHLFFTLAPVAKQKRIGPTYVHFTPPPLARFLVQQAFRHLEEGSVHRESISVLDPACGSGAFLIEALREGSLTSSGIVLRGLDISDVATEMAQYGLSTTAEHSDTSRVSIRCETGNSLGDRGWGGPDVIVMNPPFQSWSDMDEPMRTSVRDALGPSRYHGRADLAFAFIAKALDNLKAGGVLAAIVPSSFLDNESAKPLRDSILSDPSLRIRLIGFFRGFSYFSRAMVEPAFIVIKRIDRYSSHDRGALIVAADRGFEDRAIRALRMSPEGNVQPHKVQIAHVQLLEHSEADWRIPEVPRQASHAYLVESSATRSTGEKICAVRDLFRPRLGVRPGHKPTFMLTESELADLAPSEEERQYFRPTADRIEHGVVLPSRWIFYPYDASGNLTIGSERQLRAKVPTYYDAKLLPQRAVLESRQSHSAPWWALARSRASSIVLGTPKIVSKAFGLRGSYALDAEGEYVVVQGIAWMPHPVVAATREVVLAYLALLNSHRFESIVASQSTRLQGGQLDLSPRRVRDLPIPNLTLPQCFAVMKSLADKGRLIASGHFHDSKEIDELVDWAYDNNKPDWVESPEDIEQAFATLVAEWRSQTAHWSSITRRVRHPAYQKIMSYGPFIIPLLLRQLEADQDDWFYALQELTNENPVLEKDYGDIERMASSWLKWGRKRGYTW